MRMEGGKYGRIARNEKAELHGDGNIGCTGEGFPKFTLEAAGMIMGPVGGDSKTKNSYFLCTYHKLRKSTPADRKSEKIGVVNKPALGNWFQSESEDMTHPLLGYHVPAANSQ